MTTDYVSRLVKAYPAVTEVWLVGSRANNSSSETSDWDYVAFADSATRDALSNDTLFDNSAVDLLVVYDGDSFEKPWPDAGKVKAGSLKGWGWCRLTQTAATYLANKWPDQGGDRTDSQTTVQARRVYP